MNPKMYMEYFEDIFIPSLVIINERNEWDNVWVISIIIEYSINNLHHCFETL